MMDSYLVQRQATTTSESGSEPTRTPDGFVVENGRIVPYWYTREGLIVKWSIFLGLMVFITLYITIGYIHAKKRIRKGLVPLAYHRWLVSRAELARVDPRYAYPQATYTNYRPGYYQQYPPGYNMQNMPPPPPMYDPSAPRPPMYDGPQGGSKLAPTQDYEAPPPGPPPAQRNDTGSSNPFRG